MNAETSFADPWDKDSTRAAKVACCSTSCLNMSATAVSSPSSLADDPNSRGLSGGVLMGVAPSAYPRSRLEMNQMMFGESTMMKAESSPAMM